MAEFCKCGSIMISGSCTNKNCSNKTAVKPFQAKKPTRAATASPVKNEVKSTRTRRASKCITYKLSDLEKSGGQ